MRLCVRSLDAPIKKRFAFLEFVPSSSRQDSPSPSSFAPSPPISFFANIPRAREEISHSSCHRRQIRGLCSSTAFEYAFKKAILASNRCQVFQQLLFRKYRRLLHRTPDRGFFCSNDDVPFTQMEPRQKEFRLSPRCRWSPIIYNSFHCFPVKRRTTDVPNAASAAARPVNVRDPFVTDCVSERM